MLAMAASSPLDPEEADEPGPQSLRYTARAADSFPFGAVMSERDRGESRFESIEDAVASFERLRDDIEQVTIFPPGATVYSPERRPLRCSDFSIKVDWVGGDFSFIGRKITEALLNHGLLTRLRIPIRF